MKSNLRERAPSQHKPSRTRSASKHDAQTPRPWQDISFDLRKADPQFPNISLRWLLQAIGFTFLSAGFCAWLLLCLLFWQGSWQLLYHPTHAVSVTPTNFSLHYQSVSFDASETGVAQLTGWWIPADSAPSLTAILVLHGASGNISDTLPLDAWLHQSHQNVFVFDYRGYGKSAPGRPSEKQALRDADRALAWITDTRHISPAHIVLWGTGLGADIAAELAVEHPEAGGVVLDQPLQHPLDAILADPRSHLVPAHWLLQDHYNLSQTARALKIPSLWLFNATEPTPLAYRQNAREKTALSFKMPYETDPQAAPAVMRWIDDLLSFSSSR